MHLLLERHAFERDEYVARENQQRNQSIDIHKWSSKIKNKKAL